MSNQGGITFDDIVQTGLIEDDTETRSAFKAVLRRMGQGTPKQTCTVVFDMWGQRCQTEFDATSELDSMTWIGRMVEKGWMLPVEVLSPDGVVLFDEETLREMFKEY